MLLPHRRVVSSAVFTPKASIITGLVLPISMRWNNSQHSALALVDSGAAGDFIDLNLAQRLQIPLVTLESPLSVTALDGKPLGSGAITQRTIPLQITIRDEHTERMELFVTHSPQLPLVLGYPWLSKHNPQIDWNAEKILGWGLTCQSTCLLPRSPAAASHREPEIQDWARVPPAYRDLHAVFSKQHTATLPPHRPYDCAIDLLPGTSPPRGKIFSLSRTETMAMNDYIREALAAGHIRPSTSPAGAEQISSALSTAFEMLQGATIFSKLDLRCAYNLVRIREGDEWKTAFNTPTGHYEYLVMPFGLSNSPSVFQALINDVLREVLNRFVFVYLDDILIFSRNTQEHELHMLHQLYLEL
ncbi:hypothetical protein AAFF_G00052810 [Aldrovandia affinis]|uniref:ribonuclease H n=1 Tax=Aldrovandia affinis TaxID=143900 RepID=A0AAD7T6I4_9TELE|nr:hypothetical protein AAFF_G00052810 [Aldrovandia affinis]